MNEQFNNNGAAQQTPNFGTPNFGQQQAPFNGGFAQGQQQAPAFGAPVQGQQAPAFGAPVQGQQAPAFGQPTQKPKASYSDVTAVDLGWITPEEAQQFATLEGNFDALQQMQKSYPLKVSGNVVFSALAKPFLPKVDNGYGRQWTLKVAIEDVALEDSYDRFAAYVFAKRLSRNDSTGKVSYNWSQTINDADQNVTVEQAKELGRNHTNMAGKPAPIYPIFMADNTDQTRVEEISRDFASDGSQRITLSMNLSRSLTKRAQMSKYMFYKPWMQGVFVDLDTVKYNEFGGSNNPFQVAQQQMLAQFAAQQGVVGAAPAEAAGMPTNTPTAGMPTFGGAQETQAPAFGAPAFGQQAPGTTPEMGGSMPQQTETPAQSATPFGQPTQGSATPFGQPAQGTPAPFGQPAQGTAAPFASPFGGGSQENPFMQ